MDNIHGKVIVITGASSGLGAMLAELVVQHGSTPILVARSEEKLKKVVQHIYNKSNIYVPYYLTDVSNLDQVKFTFKSIFEEYRRIDTLVNNAGFAVFQYFMEASEETFEEMLKVNYLGTVYCTKQVLPAMLAINSGHIINIASQAGKIGTAKSSAYSASKHAILGFTNSLRLELQPYNIHITAVNPGPIRTPFFDIADQSGEYTKNIAKYMLDPYDVAEKIMGVMLKPKRELNLPFWMNFGSILYVLFPHLMDKIAAKLLNRK